MTAYQPNQNTQRSPLGHLEGDTNVDKIYKNGDMNLTEIADKILEEMDEGMEDADIQEPKVGKLFYMTLVLTVVGGFFALAYYAYQFGSKPVDTSQLQVVKADATPYKEKPEDPGGMEVPNMDKTVYDSISGNQKDNLPKVERILPSPEEPINPNGVVYKSVIDEGVDAAPKTVTNSHEALLANKGMENKEIMPVVVKPKAADKTEIVAKTEAEPEVKQEAEKASEPVEESEVTAEAPTTVTQKDKSSAKLKPISEADLKTVPEATPAKAPTPAKAVSARYKVQLGAYRSEADAAKEWNRLNRKFPDELKDLQYFVERKDLGAKGIFYRLQAGPFDDSAAARLTCSKLVASNQGCFFVEAR